MQTQRTAWHWLLVVLLLGAVGMITASVLGQPPPDARVALLLSGLPLVSTHPVPPGSAVRGSTWRTPTAIHLVSDGSHWRAFSNRSTHLGEPVVWRADYGRFWDIYSGAQWDKEGRPVAGPAPRGLDWYPVTVEGNYAIVDLSRPRAGVTN